MKPYVLVPGRAALTDASELIVRFGPHARSEAAQRADRSRNLGNLIHFCRWRQAERTIDLLSAQEVDGTVH